jgi:hypothetical protein
MKKLALLLAMLLLVVPVLCSCGANTPLDNSEQSESNDAYMGSDYLGKWYNADTTEESLIIELKSDGTGLYLGTHDCTWQENENDITITTVVDGEEKKMTGYFVISGEGFVARATEENQHYLVEGKGELQLEIMLTKNTCVDCVKHNHD